MTDKTAGGVSAQAGAVRVKKCPVCGNRFDCLAGGCWCDDVPLSDAERDRLAAAHADCLCPKCLRTLAGSKSQH